MRAAVIQACGGLFDPSGAVDNLETLTRKAAADGARLVVFPEAFIGGYPKGHHFGAPVGSRSPEGRDWFRRYFDGAIAVPGTETARIDALVRELGVDLVVGVIERAGEDEGGGTLYCTALCFSAVNGLIGKRRKLMPTAAERLLWGFGDGSTVDAFDATCGRVSAVICWENYMPMLRMSQYAQGVQFYCAPTVDDRENWISTMRTVALEGRCFVLSACQFMTRADAPSDFSPVQGEAPETVLINGGSVIISPLGDILAEPIYGEEAMIVADLDLDDIARGKMDFDVAGHYARPDVFNLSIDRRRQRSVQVDDD
ncbi:MAG: carbon-nitrogen hydrolase family protein [Pseudomonadota bacterium]